MKEVAAVQRRAAAARAALAQRDEAIRQARAAGGTLKEIADAAGVSFQRIHQITSSPEPGEYGYEEPALHR